MILGAVQPGRSSTVNAFDARACYRSEPYLASCRITPDSASNSPTHGTTARPWCAHGRRQRCLMPVALKSTSAVVFMRQLQRNGYTTCIRVWQP